MTTRMPKLVAFDLDYTLWGLWIDTDVSQPLRRDGNAINQVLDKYDTTISFYQDVAVIIHGLRAADIIVAACSRTAAQESARQALSLLLVPSKDEASPPTRAIELFDQMEIYPGSKLAHFRKLHEKTGVPYSEMLFFDDERRNREVEKLGVTFCLVPDGLNGEVFMKGVAEWREHHGEQG